MNVHILATVLVPDRIKNTLLVFKTLRTGFPTANLLVYGNGIQDTESRNLVQAVARDVGAQYVNIPMHSHGAWIENILAREYEPFFICDTDIVFFEPVQDWFSGSPELFAGRYEPEFHEPWTGTRHVSRLHPSLMWLNAGPLRADIRSWPGKHEFFSTVQINLIQWSLVPQAGAEPIFYDTCAGLHHALGGVRFTEEQNAAFGHLFCGTYVDLMKEQHPNLAARHDAVWDNPEMAKLLWADQQQWYRENAIRPEPDSKEPQCSPVERTAPEPVAPPQSERK